MSLVDLMIAKLLTVSALSEINSETTYRLTAATVEAHCVMVDSPCADIRTRGTLGGRAWRHIGLFVTASVIVNDFNTLVDELMKVSRE